MIHAPRRASPRRGPGDSAGQLKKRGQTRVLKLRNRSFRRRGAFIKTPTASHAQLAPQEAPCVIAGQPETTEHYHGVQVLVRWRFGPKTSFTPRCFIHSASGPRLLNQDSCGRGWPFWRTR